MTAKHKIKIIYYLSIQGLSNFIQTAATPNKNNNNNNNNVTF